MTETLKDMMTTRADRAPGPNVDIGDVIRTGQRRVWRRRAAGGTAACAMLAAVALVAPTLPFGGDDDGSPFADSGGFEAQQLTYAEGTTIRYGDRTIDVAPHSVTSLVQTDDGFAFTTPDGDVYFTDGTETERIGHTTGSWGDIKLTADGSSVGWFDDLDAVVFDTAAGREVLRTSDGIEGGDDGSYYALPAIDRGTAYVQLADRRVAAWDLATHTRTLLTPAQPGVLRDVADGCVVWDQHTGGSVMGRDLEANGPVLRIDGEARLSPNGDYVGTFDYRVIERESEDDVTPEVDDDYLAESIVLWLDGDRYVVDTEDMHTAASPEAHDLLTCSVSSQTCRAVVEVDGAIVYPDGVGHEGD